MNTNTVEKIETTHQVEFPLYELVLKSLKAALVFAGVKDVRYYLNSVLFDFQDNRLNIVAVDGHRILHIPIALNDMPLGLYNTQWILDRETLTSALTIIKPNKIRGLTFEVSPGRACFKTDNGFAQYVTVIDGKYPDWRRHFVAIGIGDYVSETHMIQAGYLADLSKLTPLLPKHGGLIMKTRGENDVIHFSGVIDGTDLELQLVLMPMNMKVMKK